ncbi:N-acetylneuraminate synthase [Pseudomonadota bacterium]|nr:N-acetylneuraminate synthase [Pseudomonadota bacterium]
MKKDKVFIIAEAGVNHNGSIDTAKKLIDIAAACGADAVKFQTFKAESLVSINAQKAQYQLNTTSHDESHLEMIKSLELDLADHKILIKECHEKKIMFLSSPFDIESINLLIKLKLNIFKIPSGEITNLPYLYTIGKLNRNLILSTGMSNITEIKNALDVLIKSGTSKQKITILHCNTEYPTPFHDVNLKAMTTIAKVFDIKYGYSDHTLGIHIPIAAVAMGASIIEKHFTIDKNMSGPDHKASLEPSELKKMIASIRDIEIALGDGIKQPSKSEFKNTQIARKSIVAKIFIKKGNAFTDENITTKRPGNGISPMLWNKVINQKAIKNFYPDDLIEI